jgi:transcriptional regulator with XRE-family HTH domain
MAESFDDLVARTTTKAGRDRIARRTVELLGDMLLADLRKSKRMTQGQLADAMGIRQPSVSKLEGQTDMQVSTLSHFIESLGGTLVLAAKFDDRTVPLKNFSTTRSAGKSPDGGAPASRRRRDAAGKVRRRPAAAVPRALSAKHVA